MSGGWDDDDDDLLAMLDEDDDIISSSGDDNRVTSDEPLNYENTLPPNNNTTDISALNSNPFLSNDNNDINVDNGIVDDSSNDMGGNGWDDDDLDLSDELNISDDIKDNTTPQQPSSTLQMQTYAVPPPPPPPPIHTNVNSNVSNDINDGSDERVDVVAMLAEHEKVLDKEIDNINGIEQQQQQQLQKSVDCQNDVNISDEWDFDDDDADIFNEDNVDLQCDDGNEDDKELVPEPNPPLSLQPSPRTIQPSTLNAAAYQEEEKQVPPPPPSPAPPVEQKLDTNPFLTNNSIGKDVEEPSLINEITTYTANNNGSGKAAAVNDNADADGWSDEDFFDDDDDMLQSSSSVPQPSDISPPPPHPIPTPQQQHLSPPIAQRTRAKTTSAHRQQQHQPREQQPISSQPLNPSQRKIHEMLSTYMATLHNPNFLTNLHYTLHQHQSKSNVDGEGGNKSAASDLRTYYATRPGLKKYTLGVELTRMDYNLILQNGKVINDKDVIRSYFGVSSTGERFDGVDDEEGIEEVSIEELLVRSANQSLLADMLVALTGSEDNDSSLGESGRGLILSGPTLCMTSVAESCQFKIDLSSDVVEAVCLLAISVPFHDDAAIAQAKLAYHGNVDDIIKDGRLILARAQVSVRFRPGDGEEMNDEPTVQYTVQSITPYHTATSELITTAAISLVQDQMDPFFHDEYADVNVDDVQMIDARDRFLLSHHLADSGLLVVSDHIDRLKGAAEQHSTGFRSALRQLDGVTNVSSKLSGIREGFGLALPSAEEIEAAEREAAASHHNIPRPPPPPDVGFRFPRPEQVAQSNVQSRPPPPPPPPPQQNDAPRPLIGGLFMSGLSRLAAAASQPDDNHQAESGWGGGGGTGLTPPSSPGNNQAPSEMPPTLYRRDESEHPQITQGTTQGHANQFQELTAVSRSSDLQPAQEYENGLNDQIEKQEEEDAGWSDDEFDFDDELGGNDEIDKKTEVSKNEMKCDDKIQETASLTPEIPHRHHKTTIEYQEESEREDFKILMAMETKPAVVVQPQMAKDLEVDGHSSRGGNHQPLIHHKPPSNNSMKAVPPPPPPLPKPKTTNQPQRTFEEEFVMVLSDKISAECQELEESGRMKRWQPISEDPMLRKQLMEVMVAQIHS